MIKYSASILMVLILFGISSNVSSQEIKLTREEKKEIRKAQIEVNFYMMDSLLNSRQFVLEADYLQDKYSNRIPVNSNLNFIRVNGPTGVLQTGSSINMGYNGVGGVTAEGTVNSWEITRDPKRYVFTIRFGLLSNLGHYDILMRVSSGNNASADITGLGPGRLTWGGHLKELRGSRVFKGQNTY